MRAAALPAALLCALVASMPAGAQEFVFPTPVPPPITPPYGPGLNSGVVIGPRDGCRSIVNCAPGDYANRPADRRIYDNYFKVPKPSYDPQLPVGGNPAMAPRADHSGWCAGRYRSYRASDGTFQPSSGPRRPCISPF